MASSSTVAAKALRLASLPGGPPPTPTSLMDLPQAWLLQLAKCKGLGRPNATPVALFRTCTFFRDAVARHRTAAAIFRVPIAEEDFPAEVERLVTMARRSSNVRLRFDGLEGANHELLPWTETLPHITHLLVCAMAQLEGEQPLACVKEIKLMFLEQASLVPAWVRVLCPNATELEIGLGALAPHPLHQPTPHPHLQQLEWDRSWDADQDPPVAEHVRQQLAALPSLISLTLWDLRWAGGEEQDEQQAGRLISSTLTRLELLTDDDTGNAFQELLHLPTQFPQLRELDASRMTVDDAGLEALLRLPHLERLHVSGFELRRSHVHRLLLWKELSVDTLDMGSFARLPLDTIVSCSVCGDVFPSADAVAVARVAQAVTRWGGRGGGWDDLSIYGEDVAALLVTLGPLVAALPAEQQRTVRIDVLDNITPQQLQQLGQHLPASVTTLLLRLTDLSVDAWDALLPSLPATVEELQLEHQSASAFTEQEALALCRAAVRPIRVVMDLGANWEQVSDGVRRRLQHDLVTLVGRV